MQVTESSPRTRRFGIFEVNLRAGELRKYGLRIKLQDQPFRILSLLLERHGELVTREELREELWQGHTYVDFDRSLNKAMAKLRSALGDSAECPRYIETIPRHGYRLLVPVEVGQNGEADASFGSVKVRSAGGAEAVPFAATPKLNFISVEKPAQLFYSLAEGWGFSLLLGLIVTLVALAGIFALRFRQPAIFSGMVASVSPRTSVAVLGFRNLSGDAREAWLSTALSDWLTTELSAGEQLRTLPAERIARMKAELSLPDPDSLGRESLARIHKNLGMDLVVVGSYAMLGEKSRGRIRLDLRLLDARTGETQYALSETGTEANLFDLVSRAGAQLRSRLGVRGVTREEAAEVATALPSNAEAARLYAEGLSKLRMFDALAAHDLLSKAVAAEPNFALSHAALAEAWAQLGHDQNAADEASKAIDLSSNLSRAERLLVEGLYRETSRDWDKAIEIYRALFEFFPDNLDYGLALANAQVRANRWKDALGTVGALRGLPSPLRDDPRIDLAEGHAARSLGDMKRAEAAMTRAGEKAQAAGASLLLAEARRHQAWLYENLGRLEEVEGLVREARQLYVAANDQAGVAGAATLEAIALELQGDYLGAKERYEESLAIYQQLGNKLSVANEYDNLGDIYFYFGELSKAHKSYEEALTTYREIGDQDGVALAKNGLGGVFLALGKHAEARRAFEESLAICRQIGDRSRVAAALSGLGRVLRVEGDVTAAWKNETEARAIFEELGDKSQVAQSDLSLAEMLLDQDKTGEAAALAQNAAEIFEKTKAMRELAEANVFLARTSLSQGKMAEARERVEKASAFAKRSHDRQLELSAELTAARAEAASESRTRGEEGERRVNEAVRQATTAGFAHVTIEARLGIGEIEMNFGKRESGRTNLMAVQSEASRGGFQLIAQKAVTDLKNAGVLSIP